MEIIISSRNFTTSPNLNESIENKFEKLDKYFSRDIVVNVTLSVEKHRQKVEATINANGTIFRAEDTGEDAYASTDKVVEKLTRQVSRFKSKLQKKHRDQKHIIFEELPDLYEEDEEDLVIVKKKRFELIPMTVDEAVMQMELLHHNFYVFLNLETDSVNVVYKRKYDDYGLLETSY